MVFAIQQNISISVTTTKHQVQTGPAMKHLVLQQLLAPGYTEPKLSELHFNERQSINLLLLWLVFLYLVECGSG